MRIGDRITLNDERNTMQGKLGIIVAIDPQHENPYCVRLDGDVYDYWYKASQLQATSSRARPTSNAEFGQSGLGIRGLRNYEEPPFIPSDAALERMMKYEQARRTMTRCVICGRDETQTMFTTIVGGDTCDDCL